jgi:hypothetical protein
MGYFRILGAIPGFFLSSLFLMLLWDPIAARLDIGMDINYVTAMLINITLWIAIAPLAAVSARKKFFGR